MSKKTLLPFVLIALWCSPLPAAQDIETIIITASRIPQPLHTVGSSVTVIDLDDWRGTGATISDVLREVPGLTVSQQGGSGTLTALRMRGGESNHTRILLDGIELSDPTSGVVDFAHLSIAGIERIEILRGAPSALWGSDAISGIVNLISRKGGSSSLTQKSGSNQRHETTLQVATESEGFSMQASAHHFQTRGENISLTGSERDGYRNNTLQWGGQWRPSADTDFRFSVRRTHAHSEYDGSGPTDAPYSSRNRQTYLNASLHTQTGPFQHQANLSFLQTTNQPQDAFPTESKGRRIQIDELAWRDFENCLLGRSCTLGAGLEWSRERYHRNDRAPLHFISSSVFMTLNWQPDPQATVDLSLRRDKNSDFQDADTWRVSFAYQFPGQPTRLYLASGIGIANPTLIERFGYDPASFPFQGNPGLKPERSRNTEIGIEHNPGGACCRISLSLFDQRLSDEIGSFYDQASGTSTPINKAGRSERWGGELELEFEPHPDWIVSAHYAYLHATEPDSGGAIDRKEVRRPRHQYRLALTHHSGSWNSRLDFTTVRGLLDDDFSSFPAERKTLENYYLANLSIRYSLAPKFDLLFEVRNLLDESYQEVIGYAAPHRNFSAGLVWHID